MFKNTLIAAVAASAVLGASVQTSAALPLDVETLKSANTSSVQTVGWTTKEKQKFGWGAAAGVGAALLLSGALNQKKKNNAMKMHIAYCSGKWQTYNPATNMYMSTTGPKYCYSPYL